MKKFIFSVLVLATLIAKPQSSSDAAVQISVSVQVNPAQITLNWIGNATSSQYQVFRKLKSSLTWGTAIANLNGTTNQYIDNAVSVGINYEYKIARSGTGYVGYGYVNSGIRVPEIENRGKLILMVDSSFILPLANEISRYIKDVEGDGWGVIRHNVLRTGSVTHVKNLILNDYAIDSTTIKAVFLFGHIPVPYSGNINPDGHPDHLGAWPADVYYGDVDGIWTDVSVNSTTASSARTQNVPGDGKFDQSIVPGNVELQVGRVDFNGMPSFTLTEQQLLQNYLNKNHEYRKKIFAPNKQAVIDDNFGYFNSEAFAASGYKNFAPLVGSSNILAADYFTSLTANSYLWSYGCGGGTYNSAGGIGTTANFASANLKGVFTMIFGSYFGDWDSQDNFLKAPLAQGKTLTNVWSGRPHYQFHHMGLGENIGYGLLITQNNFNGLYYASPTNITGKWIHNALMGDPTLRQDIVAPASNVVATKSGNNCLIAWAASSETNTIGYNIYSKNDSATNFVKINTAPIAGNTFTDNCLIYKGVYTYMVRALKLESGPSGTYFNMSEGLVDTAYNSSNIASIAAFTSSVVGATVLFANTSSISASYVWDFGNGASSNLANPSLTYNTNGAYNVMLIAAHPCLTDTAISTINIYEVGLNQNNIEQTIQVFPNPSKGKISLILIFSDMADLVLYNLAGQSVFNQMGIGSYRSIDLGHLAKGIYNLQIKTNNKLFNKKLILN